MSERHDPIDLFAAARPDDPPLDPDIDHDAEALLQKIISTPAGGGRTPRRRLAIVLSLAAVTVSAGTVAAVVVTRDKPTTLTSLSCWVEADAFVPSESVVVPWNGDDPVSVCESVWREGRFTTIEPQEAPSLVACVNDGGGLVVMPGDDTTCGAFGFANFDTSIDVDDERERNAIERIQIAVNESDCLTIDQATDLVNNILADNELDGWAIVAPDEGPDAGTCITAGIDPEGQRVFLVPGVDESE